jgi:DNA-binding response OmpR family regulator
MLKVMIAEDDLVVANVIGEVVSRAGYEVCGIVRTVADAIDLAQRQKPDLAVIDLRLADGGNGTDIGVKLASLAGVGVLYSTGNIARIMLTVSDGHACLRKPYDAAALLRSLEIVADMVANRSVSPPFPPGFRPLSSVPSLQVSDMN